MDTSRRRFLATTIASAAGLAAPGPLRAAVTDSDDVPTNPTQQSRDHFPQSVASGDPRATSVVLWTRAIDPERASQDLGIRLQVSADPRFSAPLLIDFPVTALVEHDHCVRVKVTDLEPAQHYFFRFLLRERAGHWLQSPVGRTRTAPLPETDIPIKVAFINCQDYVGRYYNTLLPLLSEAHDDIDVLIHLGDAIYETAGGDFRSTDGLDPSRTYDLTSPGFWRTGVRLEQQQQVPREDGDGFYASKSANTLDDYRYTHQVYRSDEIWQAVLERFPMIAIWDDHEYTDDCWGANTTYDDGVLLEKGDPELPGNSDDWGPTNDGVATGEGSVRIQRRLDAERAWFEYMPIDDRRGSGPADSPIRFDRDGQGRTVENNLSDFDSEGRASARGGVKIWGSFRFGRHLELFMTDYRTFRPDHPIDEAAWPGVGLVLREELADDELYDAYERLDETRADLALSVPGFTYPSQKARLVNLASEEQAQPGLTTAMLAQLALDYSARYYAEMGYADDDDGADISVGAMRKAKRALLDDEHGDPLLPPDHFRVDADSANALINKLNSSRPRNRRFALLPVGAPAKDGLSYRSLGKLGLGGTFGGFLGGRYLCVKPAIDLWSEHLLRIGSRRVDVLGDEQEAFLREAIPASNASWKVIGSSVSFSSLVINLARDFATIDPRDPTIRTLITRLASLGEEAGDLGRQAAALLAFPERAGSETPALVEKLIALLLPNEYYLNCDHWDGFAAKKVQLLRELFIPNNCILIAGDIHSNYVSEFTSATDPGAKAICLTVAGVSSETFQSFVASALGNLPPIIGLLNAKLNLLLESGVSGSERSLEDRCVTGVDSFMLQGVSEKMPLARADEHGVVIMRIDRKGVDAAYYSTPPDRPELPDNPNSQADPKKNNAVGLAYYHPAQARSFVRAVEATRHRVEIRATGSVTVVKGTPDSTAPLADIDTNC